MKDKIVAEFDEFAHNYRELHQKNIEITGEAPEFFYEYKVKDLAGIIKEFGWEDEGLSILDFGTGIGNSLDFFIKYFPGAHLFGVDVSEESLRIAQNKYQRRITFNIFDGVNLPFEDEKFDVVFAACVFHHIEKEKHAQVLREIKRVLKKNGALVIFEHNPLNPLTVRAVNACPLDKDAVLLGVSTLKAVLRTSGFRFCESRYRVFFPSFLRYLRPIERYLYWLPIGAQYSILARKGRAPAVVGVGAVEQRIHDHDKI
jgi:SAM-dependent methyltransferase